MRTFLAVAPPGDTAMQIHDNYARLRDAWDGVRWVPPDQYHVTLAFMGEHSVEAVDGLAGRIGPILSNFRVFTISFAGLDCFGPVESPRLLMLRVADGNEALRAMLAGIRPVLESCGMWENRAYRPHLSLGRPRRRGVKGPEGGTLLPPGMKSDNVKPFGVGKVCLYQSILRDSGPEYSVYASWSLQGGTE